MTSPYPMSLSQEDYGCYGEASDFSHFRGSSADDILTADNALLQDSTEHGVDAVDCLKYERTELDSYLAPSQRQTIEQPSIAAATCIPATLPLTYSWPIGLQQPDDPINGYISTQKIRTNPRPSPSRVPLSSSVTAGSLYTYEQQNGFYASPPPVKESWKFEIVGELESDYRPRYKSDYFPQHGGTRKPRYVADRQGNHYILVKVPPGFTGGRIRIDWVTIENAVKRRFRMPYKFQINNDANDETDCNPMFYPIQEGNVDANGFMRLYVVLIKAKQEELKKCQDLVPFEPLTEFLGGRPPNANSSSSPIKQVIDRPPKKLIVHYKLEWSQLAFTLCLPNKDGKSFRELWDTTAYSSIIKEEYVSPRSQHIQCPNCQHNFDIGGGGEMQLTEGAPPPPSPPSPPLPRRSRKRQLPNKAPHLATAKKRKSPTMAQTEFSMVYSSVELADYMVGQPPIVDLTTDDSFS